jgi:hypothetical protein
VGGFAGSDPDREFVERYHERNHTFLRECNPLANADGRAMAFCAAALWKLNNGLSTVSEVERHGGLGGDHNDSRENEIDRSAVCSSPTSENPRVFIGVFGSISCARMNVRRIKGPSLLFAKGETNDNKSKLAKAPGV